MSERAPASIDAKLVCVAAIWGGTFIAAHVVAPMMSAPAVVLVLGRGDPLGLFAGHVGPGEALILGAVLSWSAYTLVGKRVLAGLSPLVASTHAALIGTGMLVVVALLSGDLAMPPATMGAWGALAFLGVLGTGVAFVWFYEGVRRLGTARTAEFVNLVPMFAIAFGVLLLGEALEASMVVGGLVVVSGVWLINRNPPPAPAS